MSDYYDDDEYAEDVEEALDEFVEEVEEEFNDVNEDVVDNPDNENYGDVYGYEDYGNQYGGEENTGDYTEDYQQREPRFAPVDNNDDLNTVSTGENHLIGPSFNFENVVRGALDGFGGGHVSDIVSHIQNITDGGGGVSNMLSGGGIGGIAGGLIGSAAANFFHVHPETGRLLGSIAGNVLFNLGGHNNNLSDIGKLMLENLISGKFKRKVKPFVSPKPGVPNFNLDFAAERERCLRERVLFEDPEFPAQASSLYYSERPRHRIEWKRPGEIIENPRLLIGEQSRFDVVQGELGDCWFLAAAANLTLHDELFHRVVPPDQSFVENYAGIFHFQFWRYGEWVDVVIDDRLPTVNGELIYMHSEHKNEFWSALIEKAYAKLYGSYEALKGGSTAEALEDFTGGLIEYFTLKDVPKEHLLAILVRGFQMGSLFGASIEPDPGAYEARLDNGLVRGHAYSITAVQTVQTAYGSTVLLRLRNPWGEQEWNGAWSDDSAQWDTVDRSTQQQLQFQQRKDGEFWMSFDDFYENFEEVDNCNLGPEIMDEIAQMTGVRNVLDEKHWTNAAINGQWSVARGTAGGCRNNAYSFPNNPQYGTSFTIAGNATDADGKATVIIAVLQKYRRELRPEGLDSLPIGFVVYSVPNIVRGKLDRAFFDTARSVAKNPAFINLREVTTRIRLPEGNYVIVPSTFDPNDEADFLLRVYCSGNIQVNELY